MGAVHKLLIGQEYWASLVEDIKLAKYTIDISIYVVGTRAAKGTPYQVKIRNRIAEKIREGKDIQIWINTTGHTPSKNTAAMQYFHDPIFSGHINFYKPGKYHHEKIYVIDSRIVYLGSHNFSPTSLSSNYEVSARLDSAEDAGMILSYLKRWRK
jgi:phosphatidylserine/phosphatidylglycerophosphate/cardiolipin synthase-like enzyme